MTVRTCISRGCPKLTRARRCTDHQQAYEQQRGSRQERGYDAAWQQLRARAIKAQPWCSVIGCPNLDLTGDHVLPLSRGGTSTAENVQVLCSFHQTQKGAR
jgi:5-methylcytosine-specific restriction endonuclease McrA